MLTAHRHWAGRHQEPSTLGLAIAVALLLVGLYLAAPLLPHY